AHQRLPKGAGTRACSTCSAAARPRALGTAKKELQRRGGRAFEAQATEATDPCGESQAKAPGDERSLKPAGLERGGGHAARKGRKGTLAG
ncbi:unnamed protein product, partial [Symbiodinium pilosum]